MNRSDRAQIAQVLRVAAATLITSARAPNPKRVRSFLIDIFWSPDAGRLAPEHLKEPVSSVYNWAKAEGLLVDAASPGRYKLTQKGLAHLSTLDEDVASAVERGMFDKKAVQARSTQMTTRDEVLAYFQAAEPAELREVLAKVADTFSEKAEAIYDQNPEENGLLAQPYADIADLVGEASMVFESGVAPVDAPSASAHTPAARTVSQATKKVTGNPWGGR